MPSGWPISARCLKCVYKFLKCSLDLLPRRCCSTHAQPRYGRLPSLNPILRYVRLMESRVSRHIRSAQCIMVMSNRLFHLCWSYVGYASIGVANVWESSSSVNHSSECKAQFQNVARVSHQPTKAVWFFMARVLNRCHLQICLSKYMWFIELKHECALN